MVNDFTNLDKLYYGCINQRPSPNHLWVDTFPEPLNYDGNLIHARALAVEEFHHTTLTIKPQPGKTCALIIDRVSDDILRGLTLRLNLYTNDDVIVLYRDAQYALKRPLCIVNHNNTLSLKRVHRLKNGLKMHRHPMVTLVPDVQGGYAWQLVTRLTTESTSDFSDY